MTETGSDILFAAALLRRGELVAIPTETVYGLAGNALDAHAVLKIYTTKGRPQFNPLIVHLADKKSMATYAEVPELAYRLAEHFSPGPLTYVLPKKPNVPDITTSGGETVALRIPAHPLAHELLSLLDFPLAAPSANPSGYISPVTAAHVADGLGGKIPYILDGGPCNIGVESTVITFEDEKIIVLRPGGVTAEALREFGPVEVRPQSTPSAGSPGLLRSHYAPKTRLVVGDLQELLQEHAKKKLAVLSLGELVRAENIIASEVLSPLSDLSEAARNLFAALHRLDAAHADLIIAERMPEYGLGLAINDRLERASA
jgi:L-threonylcarbamoyladenylate synthase